MEFVEIEIKKRDGEWAMSDLQSHDYYELYFLVEGERKLFFEDRVFSLKSGAFCVIPPYSKHKTSGDGYKRININVSPSLLLGQEIDFLTRCGDSVAFSLGTEAQALIIPLLERGAEISLISTTEKQQISLSYTHTILDLIRGAAILPIQESVNTKGERVDEAMLSVAAYINTAYTEPLTLESLSSRFYVSKNTLSSRFKAAMNCTVIDYISFVRISRAKELLATTSKTIEEISELCGYSSANYFSLIFKKTIGISPRNYRKAK